MEFYDAIDRRRTIREFTGEPINDEVVKRILEAGMKAPSNDHMRDWQFIVVKDREMVRRFLQKIPKGISEQDMEDLIRDWNLNDACQQECYRKAVPKQYRMLSEAYCIIIPLFKQKTDIMQPENLSHLNGFASIWCCIENILLAATAEGLGCSLRIPLGDEAEWAKEVFAFPDEYMTPCFLGLGKPDEKAEPVRQINHPIDDVIHMDRW